MPPLQGLGSPTSTDIANVENLEKKDRKKISPDARFRVPNTPQTPLNIADVGNFGKKDRKNFGTVEELEVTNTLPTPDDIAEVQNGKLDCVARCR